MRVLRGQSGWVAACLVVLAAGCAPGGSGSGSGSVRTYAADEVALRVENVAGFVAPSVRATELPTISVYGDGRVITVGPTPAIYPGPALPNLQLRHIAATAVSHLVDLAVTAGVGRARDLGQPPIADAAVTRFTVHTGDGTGGVLTTSAYALDVSTGDNDGLTSAQLLARKALRDLSDGLADLPKTLGTSGIDQPQRYVPTRLAAVAEDWRNPGSPGLPAQPELVWPGPNLPGPALPSNSSLGCVTADGDEAGRVLAAAAGANAITPWTTGGKRWTVAIRPLLPDESSCDNLGR
jgi:hypothetical protein